MSSTNTGVTAALNHAVRAYYREDVDPRLQLAVLQTMLEGEWTRFSAVGGGDNPWTWRNVP